jgi:hypothetical protein
MGVMWKFVFTPRFKTTLIGHACSCLAAGIVFYLILIQASHQLITITTEASCSIIWVVWAWSLTQILIINCRRDLIGASGGGGSVKVGTPPIWIGARTRADLTPFVHMSIFCSDIYVTPVGKVRRFFIRCLRAGIVWNGIIRH